MRSSPLADARGTVASRSVRGLARRDGLLRLLVGGGAIGLRSGGLRAVALDAVLREHHRLDLLHQLRVLLEVRLRVLAALADAVGPVREPGAALLDDAQLRCEIHEVARAGDALAVENVEL